MAGVLTRFTIEPAGDDYTIHIEDDDGETLEFTATAEQLDLISEAIDEHLEGDYEELDEVDGGDADEEEEEEQ